MTSRAQPKRKAQEPKPTEQNALSEKAEFSKKMLVQALQKHVEFFLKGDSDLSETMSVLENQLINYCKQVGRVDDLIVYYNEQEDSSNSSSAESYGDQYQNGMYDPTFDMTDH